MKYPISNCKQTFAKDYLRDYFTHINTESSSIKLIYVGANLEKEQIDFLQKQLKIFGIENTTLTIKQGFAFLADKRESG